MAKVNELAMRPLDLSRFTYNKTDRTLAAEASDFGPFRDGTRWLCRIWNDSCDIGIAIRSHKTDKVEKFYLEHEEVRDGDLLAYHFKPVNAALSTVQSVVIFND